MDQQQNKIASKISSLNNSINSMIGCVKVLEKLRSYNYLTTLNDEDLRVVLSRMQELEDSIDKINKQPEKSNETSSLIKAVGKNRKLLVKKPQTEETQNINNKQPNKDTIKTNASMDKIFERNITSKDYHKEAKKRVKKLAFKPINKSF